jgi:hypothetical protein
MILDLVDDVSQLKKLMDMMKNKLVIIVIPFSNVNLYFKEFSMISGVAKKCLSTLDGLDQESQRLRREYAIRQFELNLLKEEQAQLLTVISLLDFKLTKCNFSNRGECN